jgi:hypothetical protein
LEIGEAHLFSIPYISRTWWRKSVGSQRYFPFLFVFRFFARRAKKRKTAKMGSTMLPQAKEAFESVTAYVL